MDRKKREKDLTFLNHLFESIGDDEQTPLEDLKSDLKDEGIAVNDVLSNLMNCVHESSIKNKQISLDVARKKRLKEEKSTIEIINKFKNWTKDQLIEYLQGLSQTNNSLPVASFRNLDTKSDDDLRSLVEDIELLKQIEAEPSKNAS